MARLSLRLAGALCVLLAPLTDLAAQPDQKTPPTLRLGLRVAGASARIPVAPSVVLVRDAESFVEALAHWRLDSTWPVLIDDGSDGARRNIARFVRAFGPESVVRWDGLGEDGGDATVEARVERAVAAAWGAPEGASPGEHWKAIGFTPPGVVVADPRDPAWVAAAALAVGRGQPVIWTKAPHGQPSHLMTLEHLSALDDAIIEGLRGAGWEWRGMGDAIDGVTLCMNAPTRIPAPADGTGDYALTDRIGRLGDGTRYAWCGIVFGSEAEASFRAMCALFLSPRTAWVFDGYVGERAVASYAAERALPLLEAVGIEAVFTAPSGASLDVWRGRCRGGIDAGLVHVNAAGHATWFEIGPDRVQASDVPLGRVPSIVHFIHSFSAQYVDVPTTISARWLDAGAYAYVGSVDEPYLSAFIPAEGFFRRLLSGVPFGAAGRYDDGPAWKIQVIGDPLLVVGPARPRGASVPELPGAASVAESMKESLKARRLGEAVSALVLLGRDGDALRVSRAALENAGGDAGGDADLSLLARAALEPAFLADDAALFAELYALLPEASAAQEDARAMLWQILRPWVARRDVPAAYVDLLRANIRDATAVEDATALRNALLGAYGEGAVDEMFTELIERAGGEGARQRLRDAWR